MKAMTRILLAATILAIAGPASRADQKSHRKAAEELLKVMGVEKQLQGSIDQVLDVQIKANPAIAPHRDAMKRFFTKHMSWSSLKDDFITIYVDAFTEDDLVQIRKFYETPAGKKVVQKTPELMAKGMQLGLKRVQDNQGELQQMLREGQVKQ